MIQTGNFLSQITTKRSGVIPYTLTPEGKIYFLLPRDKLTGELGDFGGGVWEGERALCAALRELREESKKMFGNLSVNDMILKPSLVDQKKTMAILFLNISNEWLKTASNTFQGLPIDSKHGDEVSEVVWVNAYEFKWLIKGRKIDKIGIMWSKVSKFIQNILCTDRLMDAFFHYLIWAANIDTYSDVSPMSINPIQPNPLESVITA